MTEVVTVKLGGSGHVAVIDAADAPLIEGWKFYFSSKRERPGIRYAIAKRFKDGAVEQTYLHKIILGIGKNGPKVRHTDRDGLNCRRSNLEIKPA